MSRSRVQSFDRCTADPVGDRFAQSGRSTDGGPVFGAAGFAHRAYFSTGSEYIDTRAITEL